MQVQQQPNLYSEERRNGAAAASAVKYVVAMLGQQAERNSASQLHSVGSNEARHDVECADLHIQTIASIHHRQSNNHI